MTFNETFDETSSNKLQNEMDTPRAPLAEAPGIDALIHALRYPHSVFGDAATPELEAIYEVVSWPHARRELASILELKNETADFPMRVLEATSQFLSQHGLKLHGNPWVALVRHEEVAGICHTVHLDLDREDANAWDQRYMDFLNRRGLLNDLYWLSLRERGPVSMISDAADSDGRDLP